MNILTINDFEINGKTVFLRVDMNCPIDPDTMEISGTKRIEEATETINALKGAKIVVASHQGRVGNKDYTGMQKHAKVINRKSGSPEVQSSRSPQVQHSRSPELAKSDN